MIRKLFPWNGCYTETETNDRDIIFDSLDDIEMNDGGDGEQKTDVDPSPQIKLKDDEATVELKKQGKKRVKVESDKLRGVDGLRRIYEEFPVICEFKGRGSEVSQPL